MAFTKVNIVMFKYIRHVLNGVRHTMILSMKSSFAVRVVGLVKLVVLVRFRTRGSFYIILLLLRIQISVIILY